MAVSLGGYRFDKVIGKGSFGAAWLVTSEMDGLTYVGKQMDLRRLNTRDRRNAENEVEVLRKLHHPNIVAYKEHFVKDEIMYIIQEYCDGGDLLGAINSRKGRAFPEQTARRIVAQLLLGLKFLHDQKIIHRDIKTENVFLMRDGTVKLGDFGLCRVLGSTELAKTVCGTPNYFAPELCKRSPYSGEADVWALGCVMFEMLNLARLFNGSHVNELMTSILDFNGPARVNECYSFELQSMCRACLTPDRKRRPTVTTLLKEPIIQSIIGMQGKVVNQRPGVRRGAPVTTRPPAAGMAQYQPAPAAPAPVVQAAPPPPAPAPAPAPAPMEREVDNNELMEMIAAIKNRREIPDNSLEDLQYDGERDPPADWVNQDEKTLAGEIGGVITMTESEYAVFQQQIEGLKVNMNVIHEGNPDGSN